MITALVLSGVALVLAAVYFVWPDAMVMNVMKSARRKKALRKIATLPLGRLTEMAHAGDVAAQYRLGHMHATGDGAPLDYSKANYWLERASNAGVVEAMYCLGLHHEHGRGMAVDYDNALKLYGRAAEAGSAMAQCNMGMMYLNGHGMPVNWVRAAYWFVRAMSRGIDTAEDNLRWLIRNRRPLQPAELDEIGKIERDASAGEVEALLVLGWMHAAGFGKAADASTARALYAKAQSRGHLFAHVLLARLPEGSG